MSDQGRSLDHSANLPPPPHHCLYHHLVSHLHLTLARFMATPTNPTQLAPTDPAATQPELAGAEAEDRNTEVPAIDAIAARQPVGVGPQEVLGRCNHYPHWIVCLIVVYQL